MLFVDSVGDFALDPFPGELVDEVGDFLLGAREELQGAGDGRFSALLGGAVAVKEDVFWGMWDLR